MGYFKTLQEKWKITLGEDQEMKSLKNFIKRTDSELYFGNYNDVSIESIDEVKKAEKRLAQILAQIKIRRRNALIGK